MFTINIKPIVVTQFPEVKTATKIIIHNVRVLLLNQGVTFEYILKDENDNFVFQGSGTLTEEEIANWVDDDTQLINTILNKLNLEVE